MIIKSMIFILLFLVNIHIVNAHIKKFFCSLLIASPNILTPNLINLMLNVPNYDNYASSYDILDKSEISSSLGIDNLRHIAGSLVQGNVLEVAVGTGIQLDYYDWSKIFKYNCIDNSRNMLDIAKERLETIKNTKDISIDISSATRLMDAMKLDLPSNTYDTVIDTFSLCVIENPLEAIKEMKRVAKPGGRIVLLENSRSTQPLLGLVQDVTEPIITPLSKYCKWNVNIPLLAKKAGLIEDIRFQQEIQLGTITLRVFHKE